MILYLLAAKAGASVGAALMFFYSKKKIKEAANAAYHAGFAAGMDKAKLDDLATREAKVQGFFEELTDAKKKTKKKRAPKKRG